MTCIKAHFKLNHKSARAQVHREGRNVHALISLVYAPLKNMVALVSQFKCVVNKASIPFKCAIKRTTHPLQCILMNTTQHLHAKVGIVCSVNNEVILRFAEDKLTWDYTEQGIIKYNLLISSGIWELEELL